jgi:tetratricopeptide (TPR) repeat protein
VAVCLALNALVACAAQRSEAYLNALAAGDRAFTAGRMRDAAEAYDRAFPATARGLDRDEGVYRAGQCWLRAGDETTALARFDWLAVNGREFGRGPRGALEAARIRLAHGDNERAERDLLALARRWPATAPARRAFDLILEQHASRDPSGTSALAWIDQTLPSFRGTALEPNLVWRRARQLAAMGRYAESLAAYETLMAFPYPFDVHLDDGALEYAQLLEHEGRPRDAIRVIDRALSTREVSLTVPGEYERPHYHDLQWMKARVLRDDLHDAAAAADAFHDLYAHFRDSILRDNALAEEAALREQLGQHDRVCDIDWTLAREFPCTRFGRHAAEQLASCGRTAPADAAVHCHRTGTRPSEPPPGG